MAQIFEVVVFTASMQAYADPVIDCLDTEAIVSRRFYRDSCREDGKGAYVKDLSILRDHPGRIIIIDNSPEAYQLQPENALPCPTWVQDPEDTYLRDVVPFLQTLATVADVRNVLGLRLPSNVQLQLSKSQLAGASNSSASSQ